MFGQKIVAIVLAFGLSACSLTSLPEPEQDVPLPDGFVFSPLHAAEQTSVRRNDAWWTDLNDALLTRLIEEGLGQNLDIQISLARLEAARAALGGTGLAAQVQGSLDASVRSTRPEGLDWDTRSVATFDPVFIVDLFGQEAQRRNRASAELRAAGFDTASTRLALQLDMTRAYLDVRYFDRALEIMRASRDNRTRYLSITEDTVRAGAASEREIQRATAALLSVRLELTDLEVARSQAALRLATLVAVSPAEMLEMLDRQDQGQPRPGTSVGVGMPAELLRNRPDILTAEARLEAAVANFGVTAADLLPSLQLSGTLRASTTNLIELGPSLRLPILDRWALNARKEQARARVREAELLWKQSIRTAIEEVELGLSRATQAERKRALALRFLESSQRGLDISTETYQLGDSSLADLLDAERDVSEARMQLAEANRDFAAAWAQLQIAVGHGWHGVYRVERCCENGEAYSVSEPDTMAQTD